MTERNLRDRTLFHRDTLGFLRGIDSEAVHHVATGPTFNKSRDFHDTPDSLAASCDSSLSLPVQL